MYWILGAAVYLFLGLGFGLLLEMRSTSFTKRDLAASSVLWLWVLVICAAVKVSMISGDLVHRFQMRKIFRRFKKLD